MIALDPDLVLAIDPGLAKCGIAIVRRDGAVLHRGIVPTGQIAEETRRLCEHFAPHLLVMGNGTGMKSLRLALEAANIAISICAVDESHTSEKARARWVSENPATGWQRFLPRSLRTPPVPYDDYVAVILAERYWRSQPAPDKG